MHLIGHLPESGYNRGDWVFVRTLHPVEGGRGPVGALPPITPGGPAGIGFAPRTEGSGCRHPVTGDGAPPATA
jgi:hypothetical protein